MRKKSVTKPASEFRFPPQDKDLPATQGMLQLVRNELKSEMKAGFGQVDARFNQIDARFAQFESKFAQVDSRFEQILSEISRIGILVEEQNSRNRIVLEGLAGLWQRQDRIESRVDDVEKTVRSIARYKA
jgi:hypothetical protein